MVRTREQRTAAIDLRHLVNKSAQTRRIVEHESVDRDVLACDPFYFLQRLLRSSHADSAKRQRPFAVKPLVQKVCSRLSIGDYNDVLIARRMPPQKLRGEAQAVLQVGEWIAHVPRRFWQILQLQFHRARIKTDDR